MIVLIEELTNIPADTIISEKLPITDPKFEAIKLKCARTSGKAICQYQINYLSPFVLVWELLIILLRHTTVPFLRKRSWYLTEFWLLKIYLIVVADSVLMSRTKQNKRPLSLWKKSFNLFGHSFIGNTSIFASCTSSITSRITSSFKYSFSCQETLSNSYTKTFVDCQTAYTVKALDLFVLIKLLL